MIHIHPSVIMSISEHHTRMRLMTRDTRPGLNFVIGALLGKKTDLSTEICDCFELRINRTDGALDREYYEKKIPLVQQVSGDLHIIGWYTTSSGSLDDTSVEERIHKQISDLISNPLLVKLHPYRRDKDPKISGSLPVTIHEPVLEIVSGCERVNFIEVAWNIVTEAIEIIGLEHNAKLTHVNVAPSAAVDNLRLQLNAVKMLKDRIKVISRYVKDVQSGVLPYNNKPMTGISRLVKKFPLMNSDQYRLAFNTECNDVALNTYLGMLTKGSMCKLNFGAPGLKSRAYSTTHARK